MDARPVVVYDANVLYPAHLRDLLLRLAVDDLVRPHWSEDIHGEWMRNVHADHPDVTWEDLEYTRGEMDRAFPYACVEGYEHRVENLSLPDPEDRHVLAAAIEIGADSIVTFNLDDFPAPQLDPHGIEALHPDAFTSLLMDRDKDGGRGGGHTPSIAAQTSVERRRISGAASQRWAGSYHAAT